MFANFELNMSGTTAHATTNTSGRVRNWSALSKCNHAETYEHIRRTKVRSWVKMLCVLSIELGLIYFDFTANDMMGRSGFDPVRILETRSKRAVGSCEPSPRLLLIDSEWNPRRSLGAGWPRVCGAQRGMSARLD